MDVGHYATHAMCLCNKWQPASAIVRTVSTDDRVRFYCKDCNVHAPRRIR